MEVTEVEWESKMDFIHTKLEMRNALGKEYGGSGVPLDFDKYAESVDFWKKHAILK